MNDRQDRASSPRSQTRRSNRARLRSLLSAVIGVWAAALCVAQSWAVLQPPAPAPSLNLADLRGETRRLDFPAYGPALLLFVKPGDRHTSAVLGAINALYGGNPAFSTKIPRCIVASRLEAEGKALVEKELAASGWTVLLDKSDSACRAYQIATPTVVLVGADGHVAAANPGFDHGLENHLRAEIARLLSQPPPSEAQTPSKAKMYLQMGRRLAGLGLWERAFDSYEQAAKKEPLSPENEFDLARILIETKQFDRAAEITRKLRSDPRFAQKIVSLEARLNDLKKEKGKLPQPPPVAP